ncbi:unnamed protein product, partial [Gordionus sp. m RMFG-2023]
KRIRENPDQPKSLFYDKDLLPPLWSNSTNETDSDKEEEKICRQAKKELKRFKVYNLKRKCELNEKLDKYEKEEKIIRSKIDKNVKRDNKHTDNTNHPDLLNFADSGANYDAESPLGKKVMLPKSSDIKLEEATRKDIPGSSKNTSEKK